MDKTYIGSVVEQLTTGEPILPYSGVRILYTDADGKTAEVFAGTDDGSILEFEFPWSAAATHGSQLSSMAQDLLSNIEGKTFTPYQTGRSKLNPAAEIGDGANVFGVYSPIASRETIYDSMCYSSIGFPLEEEIEHEFQFQSPIQRSIAHLNEATAQLIVQNGRIEERVESAEGDISSLEIDVGGILAQVTDAQGNYTVLTMTANGIIVRGSSSGAVEINGGQLKAGTVQGDRLVADVYIQSPTIYGGEYYSQSALAKLELDETLSSGYTYPALILSDAGVDAHEMFRVDQIYPGSSLGKIERMLMFEDVIMSYWKGFSTAPDTLFINASALNLPSVVIAGSGSFGTADPPVTGKEQRGQLYFQLVGY